ncbi:MAG: DUF2130 domain-containing protein [Treponema sp.]|nr:DUF2130 domain-containing protein [Treponema sp.]
MNTVDKIKCPACGTEIDVNMILSRDIEARLKKDNENEYLKRLETEKTKIRETLTIENEEAIKTLQKSLREKSEQVNELNKVKADLEKTRLEKEEAEYRITAAKDAELNKKLKEERDVQRVLLENEKVRIRKESDEINAFKIDELQKKLDDQTALADEMKRKAEQGSVQLQGEVQELAIEDILRETFRFDIVEPVPKGINGADVIQKVRNNTGNEAGIIAYESKRTKAFGKDWTSKLKEDGARVKADICVLVTETMPEDISRIGQKDGVWICSFGDFKGLSLVLRDSLIRVNAAFSSQTNKGEKMQMLYDYLTGREFSSLILSIIESFGDLQRGYFDERNRMERIWKAREKQLEKLLLNTNSFIGSIKGIAGNSLAEIPMIEDNGSVGLSLE